MRAHALFFTALFSFPFFAPKNAGAEEGGFGAYLDSVKNPGAADSEETQAPPAKEKKKKKKEKEKKAQARKERESAPAPTPAPKEIVAEPKKAEVKAESPALAAAPAKVEEPTLAKWKNWSLNAYFDAYYSNNFNNPGYVKTFGTSSADQLSVRPPQNQYRYYDWYTRSVNVNLAEATIKYSGEETSFLMDLDFGHMADINAIQSNGTNGYSVDESTKHIGQAVLTYNPAWAPRLSFDLGKMYTHVGLETPKAKDNWNYSRSTLFGYGIPIWHVGLSPHFAVIPDKVSVSGYVYTGWNTAYETNNAPTLGAQLHVSPSAAFSVNYNLISGPEQAANPANKNTVHELNFNWQINEIYAIQGDLMSGQESNVTVGTAVAPSAKWLGATFAARAQILKALYGALRWEAFRDKSGYRMSSGDQTFRTYTATVGVQAAAGLEVRGEYRLDNSTNGNMFQRGNGTPTANQNTVLLGVLYSM